LTTTFQTAEEQLHQFVHDPRESIEKRVAMADIRGRFGYMKRALPNFIEVGRQMSEALNAGRVEEAAHIAAGFAPYRSLFGEDLTAVRDELAGHCQLNGPKAPFSGPARLEWGSIIGEQRSPPTRAAAPPT
jgi:hypothetical protein